MSNTQLKGVVAHIVSHADGVVNDKAALTQRLTAMGAAVAGRFSGLVTHIIFRRKPQANKEERLAEDQALWDLYTRIGKAAQLSNSPAQIWIVEPFWIEACFSSRIRAPEKPHLLPRPDSLLHLPRTKTPGSSAGKKRRRNIQQPKPAQKYDLDVAAFEFSSTQKMHDEEPLQSASTLRREGACEQALQLEDCPGSAGSVPALPSDQVIDLTAMRPSSAPSHLETSSQVEVNPKHDARDETQKDAVTAAPSLSPAYWPQSRKALGLCDRPPAQLEQPATAAIVQDAAVRGLPAALDSIQQRQLYGTEDTLTRTSLLEPSAGLARLHGADMQPSLPAMLELDATRKLQTPAAACRPVYSAQAQAGSGRSSPQEQQQHYAAQSTPLSRDGLPQKLPLMSGLSRVHSLLRTPTLLSRLSPPQPSVLPSLTHASASAEVQITPMRASKLCPAQQHLNHQTPGITPRKRQLAGDSTAKRGACDMLSRADSTARARTPMALTIPRLKSTPASCSGQSPLAFPALSPAAAQPAHTPQIRPDQPAMYSARVSQPSATPAMAQETGKQQEASGSPSLMPRLQSSNAAQAAACQPQTDTGMQRIAVHEGLGFGSPVLIEDTPQGSGQDRLDHDCHKPAAALECAEVQPLCDPPVPMLCAQRPSPAAAPEGAQAAAGQHIADTAGVRNAGLATAVQHQQGSAADESIEPLQRTATAQGRPTRKGRRRHKGAAAQQENAGSAPQQAAGDSEQRQPLAPMNTAALYNADGSEGSSRGRKRHRSDQQASKRAGVRKIQRIPGARGMKTVEADARERSQSQSRMKGSGKTQGESLGHYTSCSGKSQAASQHTASAKGAAVLCLSSVSDGEGRAAVKAVKQLGGMRLCASGTEEHVTHLVMGSPRRTLKVLLAIAAGAWLLTPDWIAASMAAGMWLDEHSFQAETPFASAAARARENAADGGQPLLAGRAVHIMRSACAKQSGDGPAALASMALAHGAKVTGLRQCDLCVVCQGAAPPDSSKCPLAVRESWLLDLAASFMVPELSDAYDARQPAHVQT